MKHKKNIFILLCIEEYVAIILSISLVLGNVIFFSHVKSDWSVFALMIQYFSFGSPFFRFFFFFIYGVFFFRFIIRLAHLCVDMLTTRVMPSRGALAELLHIALSPLRTLSPIAIVPLCAYTLLANMNFVFRFMGHDEAFLVADHAFTGVYFLFDLARIVVSPALTTTLFYFYVSLSLFLPLLFIVLYVYSKKKLYREAIIAFMLSIVVSIPIFSLFPLQGPYNYFIRNLRHVDFTPKANEFVQNFHPSQRLLGYLDRVSIAQTAVNNDNAVPISCFPSMHAMWGIFVVYYLSRIKKITLLLFVPWWLLMLTGGLMLGQHYLIDYLASVPLAMLCIYSAQMLLRKWGTLGKW